VIRSRKIESQPVQLNVEEMKAAVSKLERRIKDLETFDVTTIQKRWDPTMEALQKKINSTLLEILGHGTTEYSEYSIYSLDTLPIVVGEGPYPLADVRNGYLEGIKSASIKLKTLKEIFEERIMDAIPALSSGPLNLAQGSEGSKRIFVVHGHDEGMKEAVARYLSKLALNPIILHEEANQGKTVIEKFESYSDVVFAVVLFTPDDIGYPMDKPDLARSRPRQNVVLELGFFLGKLNRKRVCVLHKGNVEIPTDYVGVIYVPFDDGGSWRVTLAREMKSVGIDIDLNKSM
jgi:predicted nucleotide-binding protein